MHLRVTHHAITRYQIDYPDASIEDIEEDIQRSDELQTEIALAVTGRNPSKTTSTHYLLSSDRRGVFAVEIEDGVHIAITYLRLGLTQKELLDHLCPPTEAKEPALPRKNPKTAQAPMSPDPSSVKARLRESPSYLRLAVGNILISPDLGDLFGTKNKARIALIDARVLRSEHGLRELMIGDHRVSLTRDNYRWTASVDSKPGLSDQSTS